MSNKYGGVSWHSNIPSKKGIVAMFKCSTCGRAYKQEYTRNRHQKQCEQKNPKEESYPLQTKNGNVKGKKKKR